MKQSTLDTIAGIVRALMAIIAIFIGKDLPVEQVVNNLLPVIAGAWALFELVKGWFSNSKHIKQ